MENIAVGIRMEPLTFIHGDIDRIRFSDGIAVSVVELTIACELAFDAASIYSDPG